MPYEMRGWDGTTQTKVFETYNGFSPYKAGAEQIAIATFDGEPELYAIDDGAYLPAVDAEIKRKYRDDYSREPELVVYYVKGWFPS